MKKILRLLALSALVGVASMSNVGATQSCGNNPPCAFVEDDCAESHGNWYTEIINDCLDSNNQTHQLYSYTCSGRGVFLQGACYI
jgi:hypothetical protein